MKDKICETIKSSKKLLRKRMTLVLNNLSHEDRVRQSEVVMRKLISLPQYQKSKRISIYLSVDNEINTLPILKDMFANGKEVFIPKFKGKMMTMVKLKLFEDYERLAITKYNIRQPSDDYSSESSETLDLVCLPGVAFTKSGKRLGHGMGYYDKYLNNYISFYQYKPYLVGLAFNEQLVEDIPTVEHDVRLDLILTENHDFSSN